MRCYLVGRYLATSTAFLFLSLCSPVSAADVDSAAGPVSAANIDFAEQIRPIFMESCAGCHGEKKGLGKLRLHTAEVIQKRAAADEHLLVAGEPDKSDLYKRLVLAADHKKRMPKKADPLSTEKIQLIRLWIEQGANFGLAVAAVETIVADDTPEEVEEAAETPTTPPPADLPLPEVAPADQAAIDRLVDAGAQVLNLYSGSPLLQVSFALRGKPAGDHDVALLAEVADQIYSLNLAGSKVSNDGMAVLANLKNLRRLHLENSSVSDAGLSHVASLTGVQFLNLYGTTITDAGIAHLGGWKHLQKLYLWQSKISYEAAMALKKNIPGLAVSLGYDHPVIAGKRLAKELKQAKKMAKEAAAKEKEVKVDYDAATKAHKAAKTLVEQIKQDIAALGDKASGKHS